MHPAFARSDHRPWPMPTSRWTWRQSWHDLLFAHWPIDAPLLRPLIPEALQVQEFDGTAWIAAVPFRMSGVMRRPLPDLPWISAFPELNIRTYVEHDGKPGVWFLSLDATNPLAVWAAKRFFHLPYYRARMELSRHDEQVAFRSRRNDDSCEFIGTYEPTTDVYETRPGTLDHWLTERYCLYAETPTGRLTRTEVHHVPWPLQHAKADIATNSMLSIHGLDIHSPPPILHFARRLDVVVWSPVDVS